MNTKDNRAKQKAIDSLLNFETVTIRKVTCANVIAPPDRNKLIQPTQNVIAQSCGLRGEAQ